MKNESKTDFQKILLFIACTAELLLGGFYYWLSLQQKHIVGNIEQRIWQENSIELCLALALVLGGVILLLIFSIILKNRKRNATIQKGENQAVEVVTVGECKEDGQNNDTLHESESRLQLEPCVSPITGFGNMAIINCDNPPSSSDCKKKDLDEAPIQKINEYLLKAFFDDKFLSNKYPCFIEILKSKNQAYKKVEYGKLALLLYEKKQLSEDALKKYKRTYKGNFVFNYSLYFSDFYNAIGVIPSTTDLGYYEKSPHEKVENDFRDIFNMKS